MLEKIKRKKWTAASPTAFDEEDTIVNLVVTGPFKEKETQIIKKEKSKMFNKKIISLVICILLLTGMVTGCIGQQAEPQEGKIGEGEKVEVSQELNIALGRSIGGLDPHGSLSGDARIIWRSIYETLVYLDENLEIQPRLATSWEVSEDAKVWTFNLREGVKLAHSQRRCLVS